MRRIAIALFLILSVGSYAKAETLPCDISKIGAATLQNVITQNLKSMVATDMKDHGLTYKPESVEIKNFSVTPGEGTVNGDQWVNVNVGLTFSLADGVPVEIRTQSWNPSSGGVTTQPSLQWSGASVEQFDAEGNPSNCALVSYDDAHAFWQYVNLRSGRVFYQHGPTGLGSTPFSNSKPRL